MQNYFYGIPMGSDSESKHTHYHHTATGFFDIFSIRNILHVLVAVAILVGYYFKDEVFASKIADAASKIETGLDRGDSEIKRLEDLVKSLQDELASERKTSSEFFYRLLGESTNYKNREGTSVNDVFDELLQDEGIIPDPKVKRGEIIDIRDYLEINKAAFVEDRMTDYDSASNYIMASYINEIASKIFHSYVARTSEFKTFAATATPSERVFASYFFAILKIRNEEELLKNGLRFESLPDAVRRDIEKSIEHNVCRFMVRVRKTNALIIKNILESKDMCIV